MRAEAPTAAGVGRVALRLGAAGWAEADAAAIARTGATQLLGRTLEGRRRAEGPAAAQRRRPLILARGATLALGMAPSGRRLP